MDGVSTQMRRPLRSVPTPTIDIASCAGHPASRRLCAANRPRDDAPIRHKERWTMAISATFNSTSSLLTVIGDNLDNTITVSRDAAGKILVNGGAVAVDGRHAHRRQHQPDPGLRPGRQRHDHPRRGQRRPAARATSSAAPATTPSPAAPATTCSSARPATTPCSARAATTCSSAATATTR